MSVHSFIQAMPKVELGLQLEGSIPKATLLRFAERNGKRTDKGFSAILEQYEAPTRENFWDVIGKINQFILYPDDLTRAIYDTGVALSKQNIRYAEIGVSPVTYMSHGMSFEEFTEALLDGADRAQRGWNIQMRWLLTIPYDEPRRGDEIACWVATSASKKAGIIGLGLNGVENKQPAAQFERPFRNAEKREIGRVVWAGDVAGLDSVNGALSHLSPNRVIGAWGIAESDDTLKFMQDSGVAVGVLLSREKKFGRIEEYAEYPLAKIRESGIDISLSAGMPEVYKTTTTNEFIHAYDAALLSPQELEEMTLNSIQISLMTEDDKQVMMKSFVSMFESLKQEHLTPE